MNIRSLNKSFTQGFSIAEAKGQGFVLCLELLFRNLLFSSMLENVHMKLGKQLEAENIIEKLMELLKQELKDYA